jgi:uncharacterized phage protein (TIGR02220 family)
MPRINVEDEFWSDPRLEILKEKIGRFAAVGACLSMWKMAQKYWNGECKPIPKEVWTICGFPKELFDVGMAVETTAGVYVKGSQKHFEWYKERCESAKIAGRASAAKRANARSTSRSPAVNGSSTSSQPSSSSSSSSSKELGYGSVQAPTPFTAPVIDELNRLAGTHFKSSSQATRRFIEARVKDDPSLTLGDMLGVVRVKCRDWKDDPKMRAYLRPETLFNATKFEAYLSQYRLAKVDAGNDAEVFGE